MTWVPRPPVTLWPAFPRPRCSPGQRWGCQECPGCQDTLLILHSTLAPSPPAIFLVSGQLTVSALHQVGGGRQTEIRRRELEWFQLFRIPRAFPPSARVPLRTRARVSAPAPRGGQRQGRPQGDAGAQGALDRVPQERDGDGDHQVRPVSAVCVMCVSLVMWIIKWGETLSVQFWKKPRGLIEPIKRKTSHQVFIQTFLSKLISNASSGW